MEKRNYSLKQVFLAFVRAAKDHPYDKTKGFKKIERKKLDNREIKKRVEKRQQKVERERNTEKLRLKVQYVHLLRAKLELLERDYLKLKKSKKYKKSDLNKIENKIKKLKEKLKVLSH
jgi:chromosome segregation ATPase